MTTIRRDLASLVSQGPGRSVIAEPPSWMDDALCAQVDPALFYPEDGGTTRPAKRICRACPVLEQCAAYALDNGEIWGIWGAMSEFDRRKARRALREAS